MSAAGSRGVERVLAKCQKCVENGQYYEAHQMYRGLYSRYMGSHKYTEAMDLVYKGALTLFHHGQNASATDLSMLLLDVLKTAQADTNEENMNRVVALFKEMDMECPERQGYLSTAIRWTALLPEGHKRGHPELHQGFAFVLWQEKNYSQARYHYLHSGDGKGCATMLIEYHTELGYPSEVDLFIAQAVLQYLCLQNKTTASDVFFTYTENHPSIGKGPPFCMPLLNFLWFLLLALEGGKLAVFTILCEQYEPSINRDPSYKEYLDKIGQVFFGVPPPPKSQSEMFGNLLQSLMGSGDNSDDDDFVTPSSSFASLERPLDLD